jgi:hypothetical protein
METGRASRAGAVRASVRRARENIGATFQSQGLSPRRNLIAVWFSFVMMSKLLFARGCATIFVKKD